jgi:putative FmdB family regulatory protein
MPTYVYRCEHPACGRCFETTHPAADCATDHAPPQCPACGHPRTYRVPQPVRTNWGGLAPSQGELAPAVRALVDDDNRRRRAADYAARHGD